MASKALVKKLTNHNVRKPIVVIQEAERAGLGLANALAMLEKETGIPQRNIFGCDHGPQGGKAPFCQDAVTEARVAALRRLYPNTMNGVGWPQLTWYTLVNKAERMGGAHRPRYQMRVGFKVLADLIRQYGQQQGFRRYNGSGAAAEAYAREAVRLASKWKQVLN